MNASESVTKNKVDTIVDTANNIDGSSSSEEEHHTNQSILETQHLIKTVFDTINQHLSQKGLLMREGSIVDATLIAAPFSTNDDSGERDPEMHQTKKGNQSHFGKKAHIPPSFA